MARISRQVMNIRIQFDGMPYGSEQFVEVAKRLETALAVRFGVGMDNRIEQGAHVKVETVVEVTGEPDITIERIGFPGVTTTDWAVLMDGRLSSTRYRYWHVTSGSAYRRRGDIEMLRREMGFSDAQERIAHDLIRKAVGE